MTFSCLNGGTCNSNGTCSCIAAFAGSSCQSCMLNQLFSFHLFKIKVNLKQLLDIGCRAGGALSCKNDGKCLLSGACDCQFGYGGAMCENCD